jgi:superfamily II DNA/RNA helicase
VKGWPVIRSGKNVLVAAPTGSGKTLTAFLACLDELFREAAAGTLEDRTTVLYVSARRERRPRSGAPRNRSIAAPITTTRWVASRIHLAIRQPTEEDRRHEGPFRSRRASVERAEFYILKVDDRRPVSTAE